MSYCLTFKLLYALLTTLTSIINFYIFFLRCLKHSNKSNLGKIYNYHITKNLIKIIKRHEDKIFKAPSTSPKSQHKGKDSKDFDDDSVTRDANGFPINRSLMCLPDKRVLTAKSITDFDQYYTW